MTTTYTLTSATNGTVDVDLPTDATDTGNDGVDIINGTVPTTDDLLIQYATPTNAGTGNYDTFLRIDHKTTEQGFNTDGAVQMDTKSSPHTHSLLISSLATVQVNGVDYYEFRLDLNESSDAIALAGLKLYTGTDPNATSLGAQNLAFDLGDNVVNLTAHSSGSGDDDYVFLLPKSVLDAALGAHPGDTYLTLYAKFTGSDDGFEEFRALTTTSTPVTPEADIVVIKTPDVTTVANVGDVINYTIQVQNDGTAAVTGLTVVDPLTNGSQSHEPTYASGDTNTNGVLDPGEIWTYNAQYIVTAADIANQAGPGQDFHSGVIANVVTASGNTVVGPVSGSFEADVFIAHITVTKTSQTTPSDSGDPSNVVDHAGQAIDYTVTVTNDGNADITGLVLTDALTLTPTDDGTGHNLGDANQDGVLNVGEAWTYTASTNATQGQIDAGGAITNHVSVTDDQHAGGSADASNPVDQDPALNIEKLVSANGGTDWYYTADDSENVAAMAAALGVDAAHLHAGTPTVLAGASLEYDFVVTNTGNVTLTNVTATDVPALAGPAAIASLAPGQTVATAPVTVTAATGAQPDTVTGSADPVGGVTPTDTDDGGYVGVTPSITVDKALSGNGDAVWFQLGSDTTIPNILVGNNVDVEAVVKNTSGAGLAVTSVTIGDDDGTSLTGGTTTIADGATTTFAGSTAALLGQHTDTVTVNGTVTDDFGNTAPVSATDSATYNGVTAGLSIEKDVSVDGKADGDAGKVWFDADAATGPTLLSGYNAPEFRYVITNTGTTDLKGVVVTDDKLGAVGTVDVAAGQTVYLYGTGTWGAGQQTNTGQAAWSYTDSVGNQASGSPTDPANYFGAAPAIAIAKVTTGTDMYGVSHTGDGIGVLAGGPVTWTYTVTNTGNVALSGVAVTDSVAGVNPTAVTDAGHLVNVGDTNNDGLLETGENWLFTASGAAIVGTYSNTGTASGSFSDDGGHSTTVTAHDDSSYFGQNPDFTIAKTAIVTNGAGPNTGKVDSVGDVINYTITVTNTGNVDLHGSLADSLIAALGQSIPTPAGDSVDPGVLNVGETWTFTWSYTAHQSDFDNKGGIDGTSDWHITNTASFDPLEMGPKSSSASVDVILLGPGVRTPGFWYNNGASLWDGNASTMPKGGTLGIVNNPATGTGADLAYKIGDTNLNNHIDAGDNPNGAGAGYLLIGDWNHNGLADDAHDLLVSRTDALTLLNASQKQQGDARWMLARDLVASWLDALAGNGVGSTADPYSPHNYIDAAAQWLIDHSANNDHILSITTDLTSATAVKTSSAAWTLVGADLHTSLDEYNNHGTIHGHIYANPDPG